MVFTFNRDKLSPFNCHHHIGHHITHLRIPSSFSVDLLYDMEVRVNRRSSLKTRPDVGFLFEGKNVSCRNRPLRLGERSCDSSTIYRGIWKGIPPSEHKAAIKRVKKTDCMEHWEVVVDWHQRGTLNHSNVLKLFGFEEDTEWRLTNDFIKLNFKQIKLMYNYFIETDISPWNDSMPPWSNSVTNSIQGRCRMTIKSFIKFPRGSSICTRKAWLMETLLRKLFSLQILTLSR